jgi:uncharacterized protein
VSPTEGEEGRRLFVDTNVFLRFFTNDLPDQAAAAEGLFKKAAAGEIELITNVMVLAELVWVLESHYRLARVDVGERAMAVALMEGLALIDADLITEALSVYVEANVDFIDAFNASWMRRRGVRRVVTFDARHYSRLGVEIEPL